MSLLQTPANPYNFLVIFAELGTDKVNCYGAMQATSDSQFAYFGTPFMNALFVVHDYGAKRLGFAQRTKI